MADEWIKMRHRLLGETEVKAIAHRLKVSRQHVAGCLLGVWSHADQHAIERPDPESKRDKCPAAIGTEDGTEWETTEGFLAFSTLQDIDNEALQPGFGEAMAEVGWLRVYEDGIGFPQYQVHHSSSAKKRASEAKKKQKQRAGKGKSPAKRPEIVPATTGQTAGPEGEGEEEGELEEYKNQKERRGTGANGSPGGGSRTGGTVGRTGRGASSPGGKELEEGVQEVLAEWDGIVGVSQEHVRLGEENLQYDRQVVELIRARLRDPYFAANWRKGMNFVRSSDFCCGRVDPQEGWDAPYRMTLRKFCSAGEINRICAGERGGNASGLTEEALDEDLSAIVREEAMKGGVT